MFPHVLTIVPVSPGGPSCPADPYVNKKLHCNNDNEIIVTNYYLHFTFFRKHNKRHQDALFKLKNSYVQLPYSTEYYTVSVVVRSYCFL